MIAFIWIVSGISLFVWPLYAMFYVPALKAKKWGIKAIIILLAPPNLLLGLAFWYSEQQEDVLSDDCGIVQKYQTYMTSGNENNRKPFERITIQIHDEKYPRHLRVDEKLPRKVTDEQVCFEFYDRKLNSHMRDSKIIQWIE